MALLTKCIVVPAANSFDIIICVLKILLPNLCTEEIGCIVVRFGYVLIH